MLQPQAFGDTQGEHEANSATSGMQQGAGSAAAGIQAYGPYRQRRRVHGMLSNTSFAADKRRR